MTARVRVAISLSVLLHDLAQPMCSCVKPGWYVRRPGSWHMPCFDPVSAENEYRKSLFKANEKFRKGVAFRGSVNRCANL